MFMICPISIVDNFFYLIEDCQVSQISQMYQIYQRDPANNERDHTVFMIETLEQLLMTSKPLSCSFHFIALL